jgi:hypothetical protein
MSYSTLDEVSYAMSISETTGPARNADMKSRYM